MLVKTNLWWLLFVLLGLCMLGCDSNTTEEGSAATVTVKMTVTPEEDFEPQGAEGGPFAPASKTYSVQVEGGPISWAVSVSSDWLTVEPNEGTTEAGDTTDIRVSLTTAAANLPVGTYEAEITFANQNNSSEQKTFAVTLTVLAGGNIWVQTNGPGGGFIEAMLNAAGILFAAGDGLYRSTDDGVTWTATNDGLISEDIQALAFNNTSGEIYVATADTGVYRSIDNGLTWNQINNGLGNLNVLALAINPGNDELFAGTAGGGVFELELSRNLVWEEENNGLPNLNVNALAFDNSGVLYAGTAGDGVFAFAHATQSWSSYNSGLGDLDVSTLAVNGDLYAGTSGGGVFVSPLGGANWTDFNTGLGDLQINDLAIDSSSNIFAATLSAGVFSSSSTIPNWLPKNTGFLGLHVQSLLVVNGDVYAGSGDGGGVHKSTDGGTNWQNSNNGIYNTVIEAMAVNANEHLFAGTKLQGTGMFRSEDNGATWTPINAGLGNYAIESIAIHPHAGEVYIGTDQGGIFKSTDNGNSWAPQNSGLGNMNIEALVVDPSTDNIYAGSDDGVFVSANNPVNWVAMSDGLVNRNIETLVIDNNGNIYAGSTGDGVYRLPNGGTTWVAFNDNLGNLDIEALAFDPQHEILYAGTEDGAFRYPLAQTTWEEVASGLSNREIKSLLVHPITQKVFAGTNGGGIFTMKYDSATWQSFSDGLSNLVVEALVAQNTSGDVYSGTAGDGVFRNVQAGTLVVNDLNFAASGQKGGPFQPDSRSYHLTADGGFVEWQAGTGLSWLDLSATQGFLDPNESMAVEATINSSANSLDVGSYAGIIEFTNRNNGQGDSVRDVTLDVMPQPSTIALSPADDFISTGQQGGAFIPNSKQYFVEVGSGSQVRFEVIDINSVDWIGIAPASGTASTTPETVTVSLTGNANLLTPGTYTTTISFNNIDDANDKQTRDVQLTVTAPDALVVSPDTTFNASGELGGPFNDEKVYEIDSTGTNINWQATPSANWLTVVESASTTPATATVSINDNAFTLSQGTHNATIDFTNLTNGNGNTTRSVSLSVNASTAVMSISPTSSFDTSGTQGGPFNGTTTYNIATSGSNISWQVTSTENWVTVDPATGTASSTPSVVTVSINDNAHALAVNNYSSTLNFVNLFTGLGNDDRQVNLQVTSGLLWQQLDGPEEGAIEAIAFSPTSGSIFVATPGGVFRSTNQGDMWTHNNAGLHIVDSTALAINTDGWIFAGVGPGGVYLSADNGDNWDPTNVALPVNIGTEIESLAINSNKHLFVGTDDSGIFRSTDNGTLWTNISASLPIEVQEIAISPFTDYIYVGFWEPDAIGGFYRSVDNGNNWLPLQTVIAQVATQDNPGEVAFGNGCFAVPNVDNNTLSIIDATTNAVLDNVAIGNDAEVVTFGNNRFAVANRADDTVTLVDATNNTPIATLNVGSFPSAIAFGNNRFAVVNNASDSVTIIDAVNDNVMITQPVGTNPTHVAFGNDRFVVTNTSSDDVTIIDATDNSIMDASLDVGSNPQYVAFGNNRFAVANRTSNDVTIISAFDNWILEPSVPVGNNPISIAFGNNRFAVISYFTPGTVTIIDATTNQVMASVNTNDNPLLATFGNNTFAVVHEQFPFITTIDATNNSIIATPDIFERARFIAFGNDRFAASNSDVPGMVTIFNAFASGYAETNAHSIAIHPLTGYIFASAGITGSTNTGGIFRSMDDGLTWNKINTGIADATLIEDVTGSPLDATLYACGEDFNTETPLFYNSTDYGDTWNPINNPTSEVYVKNIGIDNAGAIYAGTYQRGIFFSSDGGANWQEKNSGLVGMTVSSLALHPITGDIFAGTFENGIYKSTNNGDSWSENNNGIDDELWTMALAINSEGIVFAAIEDVGLYRSDDNGDTWQLKNSGIANPDNGASAVFPHPVLDELVFAGIDDENTVYRSQTNGDNWSTVSGIPAGSRAVAFDFNPNNDYLFVGLQDNGVYRSEDGGLNWIAKNSHATNGKLVALVANGSGHLIASFVTTQAVAGGVGVYISQDNGDTWAETGQFLGNVFAMVTTPNLPDDDIIYAATLGDGVFRSFNNGNTWEIYNLGLTATNTFSLGFTAAGNLLVGTAGGWINRSTQPVK